MRAERLQLYSKTDARPEKQAKTRARGRGGPAPGRGCGSGRTPASLLTGEPSPDARCDGQRPEHAAPPPPPPTARRAGHSVSPGSQRQCSPPPAPRGQLGRGHTPIGPETHSSTFILRMKLARGQKAPGAQGSVRGVPKSLGTSLRRTDGCPATRPCDRPLGPVERRRMLNGGRVLGAAGGGSPGGPASLSGTGRGCTLPPRRPPPPKSTPKRREAHGGRPGAGGTGGDRGTQTSTARPLCELRLDHVPRTRQSKCLRAPRGTPRAPTPASCPHSPPYLPVASSSEEQRRFLEAPCLSTRPETP